MVLETDLLIRPRATGIIIPPTDIKKFADKTAEYVAKNGSHFEDLLLQKELNNPKFCFLKRGDTYRAYYEHKIAEYARGLVDPQIAEEEETIQQQQQIIVQPQTTKETRRPQSKAPPQDQFTVEPSRNLSQLDLDVIKHTASFVAKNGRKFLVALTEREKTNPQFEFLRPTHDLFQFFSNLVDAYNQSMLPKKEDIEKLTQFISDKNSIYQYALDRFEYDNYQMNEKQRQQQLDDEEKQQMAMIDWNDFAVVESIDFQEDDFSDNLIQKQTQRFDRFDFAALDNQLNLRMQNQPTLPVQAPSETIRHELIIPSNIPKERPKDEVLANDDVRIVQGYIRPVGQTETLMVKCEICNRNFPKNQINEHISLELQDPRYVYIKNQVMEKGQNQTMPQGNEIAKNLQILKKKRPDIFNPVDEEESILGPSKVRRTPQPPPPPSAPNNNIPVPLPPTQSQLIPPPPPKKQEQKDVSKMLPPPPKPFNPPPPK